MEETAEGVLLKPAPIFDPASPDDVFGSLKVSGPPKTLEEMDVTLEDAALAATALDWTLKGMDSADALHLARAQGCDGFASFDRLLAKAAKEVSGIEVRTP